jgi:tRNA (guanine-N7-)-methyltransferase
MHRREIRSYVIREGRMTDGQKRALEEHWSAMGLNVEDGLIDPAQFFPVEQPLILEIGFGMGDSLFEMASEQPLANFVGVEVHRPGVGHLLHLSAKAGLSNIRVFRADSIDVIKRCLPAESLDKVQIFFPDPWHKKKHNKRRLITSDFINLLAPCLKKHAVLHIATDWAPYGEVIEEVMAGWVKTDVPERSVTKYEKRGLKLNHSVIDLAYTKPT